MRRLTTAAGVLLATAALLAGCTPPDGPPSSTTVPVALPTAPRMNFPTALPEGALLLVSHQGSNSGETHDFYFVGRDSLELLDESDHDPVRLLPLFGRLAVDGRALVTWHERPDLSIGGSTALCVTARSSDCRIISESGVSSASFSPDGTKIAIEQRIDDVTRTAILDASTLEEISSVANDWSTGSLRMPWSPDSSSVALTLSPEPGNSRRPKSLAILPATPGAVPSIVRQGSDDVRVWDVYGWSDDGWISYLEHDLTDPPATQMSIRSIPADGSASPVRLGQGGILQGHVALPDGSMIAGVSGSNAAPHLLQRGQEPVPLAQPERWVDQFGERTSYTTVYGYIATD